MSAPTETRAVATKRTLRVAFATMIAVVLTAQLFGYFTIRAVDRSVDEIVSDSLASVRLLGRLGLEIERWRVLIDEHILEQDPARLASIDRQIAATRTAIAATSLVYDPLATYPGERLAWDRLRGDEAETAAVLAPVLRESRKNRDHEASAVITLLEPRFLAIERDLDALVDINQERATAVSAEIRSRQRRTLATSSALSVVAVMVTLMIAGIVIPIVTRRQEGIESHSLELENRNRELDAFAGRVAHDLRGPLTAISLSASRLYESLPKEEGATVVLQRGVRRMERLIEDLLALSRIDAQVSGVASTKNVLLSIESELKPMLTEAGGVMEVAVEMARVRCSEGLLHQVLWNLGENAVKYRRLDVPLKLAVIGRVTGNSYELCVTDNGSGMSPEEAHRAFEPFYRGAQSRETPGTGLGLSIVKRVIECSGGAISVDSKSGDGTTFRFTIPLAERS